MPLPGRGRFTMYGIGGLRPFMLAVQPFWAEMLTFWADGAHVVEVVALDETGGRISPACCAFAKR
eukprot:1349414-Rhodomonas_salina.5